MSADRTVEIKIKRQMTPDGPSRWETFRVTVRPAMNIVGVLMQIAENPVTVDGKATAPVSYDANCLEEVCGSCAMRINGRVRMACSSLVDHLQAPIRLEPMSRFPVVRDLQVDRSRLFEDLKRVKAWIPIDGTYDLGPGPRMAPREQEAAYPFSRCISCGSCLEVCPQYNDGTHFVGAAVVGQVRLFNSYPTGKMNAYERLEALMGPGGIHECGYAQNCVEICPKEIPLTQAIAEVGGQVMRHALFEFLKK
ncbi:MAG: succinate dehydrogenase iron-sulfur subunit [Acidobacteria bacterium]|nr:succinate dehydrogenase iron-sulfur subunit [Acidobacteriota bacterium]